MEVKSHTTEEIICAVIEAVSWTELQWDPKYPMTSLRSLKFAPEFFNDNHYYTVDSIICSRSYEVDRLKPKNQLDISKGRILVYEPSTTDSSGLSKSETKGYFDANDCPPWDTWIGYISSNDMNYVLSWVSAEVAPLVDAGIKVNSVDSIYWLSEVKEPWAEKIKNA